MWHVIGRAWQVLRGHPWWTALGSIVLVVAGSLLGLDFWALGRFRAAEETLREEKYAESLALLQQCQRVWWWQTADTYLLAARLERSLAPYENGVKRQSRYEEANKHLNKSNLLRGSIDDSARLESSLFGAETGRLAEVEIQLWELVQKNHRQSPQILRSLAKGYVDQLHFPQALETLNKWVSLSPNSGEALEWRGQVWEKFQNTVNALKDYRKALAKAPHRSPTRLYLVTLLLRSHADSAEIQKHLQFLLQQDPNRPDYLLVLAKFHFLNGELQAARQAVDQVLQSVPDQAEAMFLRGELEYQDGQFSTAEKWVRKATDQDPSNYYYYKLLALVLKTQDDPKKKQEGDIQEKKYLVGKADDLRLTELMGGGLKKHLDDPDIMAEIGAILLRNHNSAGKEWLDRALEKKPSLPAAHNALAQYYEQKKQFQKAEEHKKKAKAGVPK